jgi:putative DNA primase/helicase
MRNHHWSRLMDVKSIGSMARAGYTFAPTDAGMTRSNRTGWPQLATNDIPTIKGWLQNGDSLVSVAKYNHQFILDIDDPTVAVAQGFDMGWLDGLYIVDTPSGGIHASGLHDAISNAIPWKFLNVRSVKNDITCKLIVELKLDSVSTACPSASRIGQKNKVDGVYQPRTLFTGAATGIPPALLAWVYKHMDDKAAPSTGGRFKGFHPNFDMDDFLENEDCTLFNEGEVDGAWHAVVDECPHCGKSAVNSTLRAGITKFIFSGIGVGFVCHACGMTTMAEHTAEMHNTYSNHEVWDKFIYKLDDPVFLAEKWGGHLPVHVNDLQEPEAVVVKEDNPGVVNGKVLPLSQRLADAPEGVAEPEEDIYKADTDELEWLGVTTDEDDDAYTLRVQKASQIRMTEMTWLWPDKVPAGMVTIISGKADCGKTVCLLDWLARTTTGRDWPDGSKNTMGAKRVMLCSAEDDASKTMVPRLVAAGADLDKVLIPKITVRAKDSDTERNSILNIKRDLSMLANAIKVNPDIAVLVLDPITSYLGGANINKDEEIRPLMDKLIMTGQKTGLTILALVHSNKRSDVDAVEKVMGASSVAAGARAVWTFAKDAEDKTLYRMGLAKGNVVKKKTGFEYRIVDAEVVIGDKVTVHPKIEWGQETDVDANDMLQAQREASRSGGEDSKLNIAIAVLRETVPGLAADVFEKAKAEGVNERAIYRAKDKLGIESEKSGRGGG